MTIEECNNPAICWEHERGSTPCRRSPSRSRSGFPRASAEVEVAHVEHEEVIAIGRNAELLKGVKKANFKYALGDEFIAGDGDLQARSTCDKVEKIKVGGVKVAPRDVIEAAAPDPNEIGKKYVGQTCAGT